MTGSKRGLLGDRAYALIDSSDGKVASAKNPRKWPQLFDFRAALVDTPQPDMEVPAVRIALPDGTIVMSGQVPDIVAVPPASHPSGLADALAFTSRPGRDGCVAHRSDRA
jgi:hypothetical protein